VTSMPALHGAFPVLVMAAGQGLFLLEGQPFPGFIFCVIRFGFHSG
jgi:hypothetical protein